jgi:D-psicose/D-tagatose/L-ribulose 3-epimerase
VTSGTDEAIRDIRLRFLARPLLYRSHGVACLLGFERRRAMLGMNLLLWRANLTQDDRPLLEMLRSVGYRQVEVPLFGADPVSCRHVSDLLDELGFARTALTARSADDNPISPDPAIRRLAMENSKQAVDNTATLGANLLAGCFHSAFGSMSGAGPTREEWRWAVDGIAEVADYAEARGVTLSLEFLNRFECYLLNTTAATAQFVEDVGAANVGILYDTCHANIEDPSIGLTLKRYGQCINHVHLSENHRGTPGQGLVNWDETFVAMRDIEYQGHFVVEAFGHNVPELIAPGHIWRTTFDSEEQLAQDAFSFFEPRIAQLMNVAA